MTLQEKREEEALEAADALKEALTPLIVRDTWLHTIDVT